MKKNLKKLLLLSFLLVILGGKNKNLAFTSFKNEEKSIEKINPDSLLREQFKRAVNFFRESEFLYAEQSFQNAIQTINQGNLSDKNLIYRTYVNFGVLNGRLGKKNEAIKYYNLAEKFTVDNFGGNSKKLIPIYVNKGNVYGDLDDLYKAQSYYEKAQNLIGDAKSRYLAQINNNLGNIHYKRKEYSEAEMAFKKALEIKYKLKVGNISSSLNGIANCNKQLHNYKEADVYYLKSIQNIKETGGENHYLLGDLYLNYAVFQNQIKDFNHVLPYLNRAINVYQNNYGKKHPDIANCYRNFGDYYQGQKKLDLGLTYYQRAIIADLDNFQDSSIYSNPTLNEIDPQLSILQILKAKAKGFYALYHEKNHTSDLDFSLQTYDLCLDIIDKIRIGYQNDESKFELSKNEKDTYTVAIEIAVKLYQLTKEDKYKQKAFRYSERSKAASLMSSLNDVNAKNFGGIPEDLQNEELQLRKDIAKFREKVYEERKKVKPNRKQISEWQGELFTLNEKYQKMVKRFEEEFPKYYALKYDTKTISIHDLQEKLSDNDVFMEYSTSDSALFTFIITPDSFEIFRQDVDIQSFDNHLQEVRNSLKTNDFDEKSADYYKRYTNSAYFLYKKLINPYDSKIKDKSLIIVPDGKMAYIPFGVLLVDKADSTRMNYRNLNYLIKSHNITYQNSATIGFSIEPASYSFVSGKSVLGFAPSYENVDDSILYTKRAYRDKLYPLPGAKEEVENISKVMKEDIYLDDKATEENFKEHAGDYDILHLAMHTIIDDKNPMYSKLVFTQNSDSIQDGLLNTYEIYNMQFKARMVVLSACNTGDGKLLKGEGVISLARGFFYAGCPSIVMTLWTVEDQSGSNLMTNFYTYLSKGIKKDEALRQAKLKYLEYADPLKSHPYFWSGYVTMGDIEPLYDYNFTRKLAYMAVGSIVLVLLLGFRNKRRRRKLRA